MTMEKLYAMYRWIVEYKMAHNGNSPGFREIMRGCNISSTSMVKWGLRQLERAGLIRLNARRSRSLEVVGGQWVLRSPY